MVIGYQSGCSIEAGLGLKSPVLGVDLKLVGVGALAEGVAEPAVSTNAAHRGVGDTVGQQAVVAPLQGRWSRRCAARGG